MRFELKVLACLLVTWTAMLSVCSALELYLWDAEAIASSTAQLQQLGENAKLEPAYQTLIRQADSVMTNGPYTVTQKTKTPPSGDVHDFCTLSPYFWPIPWLPGGKPYYFRDGKVNPEAKSDAYDRERYFEFMRTVQTLALAYQFSGDERYAQRAALLLRVWFLDEATAMNPNFNAAQVIPGLMDGCSLGVIRGSELVMILDASRLIEASDHWTTQDEGDLKRWYSRYLDWVVNGEFGQKDGRRKNNHGTWHDVHITAIALYVGREDLARKIALSFPVERMERQINAVGEQKYELRRSRSWEYSLYNLRGLYAMADLADRVGVNLWNYESESNGQELLKTATSYLAPYAAGELEWPHHQLNKSDEWAKELAAYVFPEAIERYGIQQYGETLAYLNDLSEQSRLWLLVQPSEQVLARQVAGLIPVHSRD